ncbi:MAG: hypothetical protein LBL79_07460 [Prevotella sp.]|nr:hypothetical protein [Prevotella sp.]
MSFTISQIGGFKFSHYDPKINEIDTKKPDVLTPEQLKTFLNMDMDKITPAYRDRKQVELYYDNRYNILLLNKKHFASYVFCP